MLCAEEASRSKLNRAAARLLSLYPRPASLVEPAMECKVARADQTTVVLVREHEIVWAEHRRRWVCLLCSLKCSVPYA
jgi:hypothetical protein